MRRNKTKSALSLACHGARIFRFDTAWGQSSLIYRPEPFVVYCLTLPGAEPDMLPATGDEKDGHHPKAMRIKTVLTDFFNGRRPETIPDAWLSWTQLTPKEQAVLDVVRHIPYGQTRAYGEVAEKAGFPRGARFAGNALNKNPFPVIIPCHRVIHADGSIGGFGSGCEMKRKMIAMEATTLLKGSRIQGAKGSRGILAP
jgi:methylated-DNA-[protein]-cysteine S-methyltransferase